jgi:hypothetical protein
MNGGYADVESVRTIGFFGRLGLHPHPNPLPSREREKI